MGVKQVFLLCLLSLAGCFLFLLGVVTGSGKKLVLDVRLESASDAKPSGNSEVSTPQSAKAVLRGVEAPQPLASVPVTQINTAERVLTKQPDPPPIIGATVSRGRGSEEEEPLPEEKPSAPESTQPVEAATVTDPPPTPSPEQPPAPAADNVVLPQRFEAFVPKKFERGGCKYHIRDGGPQTAQPGTPCIPPVEHWPYKTTTAWRTDLGERVLKVLRSNMDETECGGFKFYERFVWCDKAFGNKISTGLSFATGVSDTWCEQLQQEYSISATFHSCMPKEQEEAGAPVQVETTIQNVCLGLESQDGDPAYKTVESFFTGHAPLSTHVRIDTEVSGWLILEKLVKNGALLWTIRSLDLEVSLGSRAPFETELESLGARVLMDRHIKILEGLLIEFKCVGSNIEALRQGWRPSTDCPEQKCEEPDVHTKGGFSPRRFAVSFVNRQLFTGASTATLSDSNQQEVSAP